MAPTFTMNQIVKQYHNKDGTVFQQPVATIPIVPSTVIDMKDPIPKSKFKKCKYNDGIDKLLAELNKTFNGWEDLDVFRQLADDIKIKNS